VVRLFHTSDWHLGRLLYGKSLLEEQAFALARLLELIDEKRPDGLLIAGDIFDRTLPPEAAVQLFDWFCSEAALKRRLPVFVIPGNHDSNERIGFGSALLRASGLTIYSRIEDTLKPVRLTAADGSSALIYGIPFLDPALIARFLDQDHLKTPDEVTRALVARIHADAPADVPSVLMAHAFVVGGESSESERDLFVGGSSVVSADAFAGFSYTALGHLHKPQNAGAPSIRYSGSLLSYSKSEVDHAKSVTEVRIDRDGSLSFEFHALPVRRALKYLEGTLAELSISPPDDSYVIVGLTDSGPVLDALARLRAVFPNVLHVSRAGGYLPAELPSLTRARERESLSDLDLFAEFFNDTVGTELSAEERTALIETLGAMERST
jgi:exonuclease SbcD